MTNDIVQKCLSHRYVMKVHKHKKHPSNNEQTSHEWPTIHSANQDAEVVYMDEFICICCWNSLQKKKKKKMPDQACANSLKLDEIPQDLEMLLTIERQIISLWIPFITIIAMRRYGGHYKISGPPVNVPATLDQVIDMLPRMPNQLQLHSLQLKCKLEYKSHYMYDIIRRDQVMGAIRWLKEHNPHYAAIKVNENWYNSAPTDDLALILLDNERQYPEHTEHTCDMTIDGQHNDGSCNFSSTLNKEHNIHSGTTDENNFERLAFCPMNTEQDGCHEFTMQTLVHEQQQADDIRRDGNSKDSSQAEQERFHITGDSEIDGTNAELQKADTELAEDQTEIDNRQQLTGDALPTIIQFDSLENCIYQCTPGENYIPKYILLDDNFEVLAFPDLFPYGTGGYKCEDRPVNLSICKYFEQCLLNVDMRFAKNIEYLFCAQHMSDIKQIESDINLAIRLSRGRTVDGQKITAGLLCNPKAVQQLVRNEQA